MKNLVHEKGFYICKNVLSAQLIEHLQISFNLLKDLSYLNIDPNDKYYFSDGQVKNCFSLYSPSCFESMLLQLLPLMEEITSLKLYPSYSFGRIYYKDSYLKKHIDRPSCEVSATVCLKKDVDWNFFIRNKQNEIEKINLNEGDMCVYFGNELEHWREEYKGEEHIQFFLHYVNQNGNFNNFKNDRRPLLGINRFTKIEAEKNISSYKYN